MKTLRQIVLAKIETVYGTDPTPTGAANAIQVSNVKINPLNATEVDRKNMRGYMGNQGKLIADKHVTLDFDVELASSGTAGTAPGYGPLLLACALSETVSAGVSVTYAPISTGEKSATLYFNVDGKLRKLTGARGTFKLAISPKGLPIISFSFIGLYSSATDTTLPTGTFTAFQVPVAVNAINTTLSLHGHTATVSNFAFDAGVKNVYRNLIGKEDVVLNDRLPTGSVTLEDTTVAVKDWDALVVNATTGALALTHGTVAGAKVQVNAPAVQLHGMSNSSTDGTEMIGFNLAFQPVSGNDDFSIVCL